MHADQVRGGVRERTAITTESSAIPRIEPAPNKAI